MMRLQINWNSVHNYTVLQKLPSAFNDFTLLHISDLHVDMNEGAMRRLEQLLLDLAYDICVITRDYRAATPVLSRFSNLP
jgi:hypothetical protein